MIRQQPLHAGPGSTQLVLAAAGRFRPPVARAHELLVHIVFANLETGAGFEEDVSEMRAVRILAGSVNVLFPGVFQR